VLLPKMTAINAGIPRSEIKAVIIVASEKPASGYLRLSFVLSRRRRIVASSSGASQMEIISIANLRGPKTRPSGSSPCYSRRY
jgi:hypothetical protein